LEQGGFTVAEAVDGLDGLAKAAAMRPDLIILDVLMPNLDGFAVCERLRGDPSMSQTPILVMTGLDDIVSIDRAFAAGATSFTIKPMPWNTLAHTARYMLRNARLMSDLTTAMADLAIARDRAEAANLAKTQFLANMSHEMRTPLNGVLTMAQVMASGDLTPEQRDQLAVVRTSGDLLLVVINDLLDVARMEEGTLRLDVQDLDIEDVIRSASGDFAAAAADKGLELSIDLAPEAKGVWRGDAARIRQMLGNLLSNAVKFTARGGIALRCEPGDAGGLRLSVRDSGIGIAADKISLLFERFTQADNSTTRRYGGAGLGLSICHELAQLMNGSVLVVSQVGQGSTFSIELPLERASDQAAEANRTDEDGAAPPLVLVAEDNPINQRVIRALLEVADIQPTVVEDGLQAVEALRGGAFDLVLLDIHMPHMDGVEVVEAVRSGRAGRADVPVIALTADAMSGTRERLIASGFDDYVTKPIQPAELFAAMSQAMARRPETAAQAGPETRASRTVS